MLQLPVILLLVAVPARIISRFFPHMPTEGTQINLPYKGNLKVLLACTTNTWYDVVMHVMAQASAPLTLQICVMIECDHIREVSFEDDVDPHLRGIVRLMHVKRRRHKQSPIAKLQRIASRCVAGDETLVVYMDERVKLVSGWDVWIMKMYEDTARVGGGRGGERGRDGGAIGDQNLIVSCPHASKSNLAQFPTLRQDQEANRVTRGLDRKFGPTHRVELVPSVCLCTELCVFPPDALRGFRATKEGNKVPTESPVAYTVALEERGFVMAVPTIPLVEHDKTLYANVMVHDKGCDNTTTVVSKNERIGLTRHANDYEKIVKFGSCRAAKLTLQFA